jgi:transposase
MIELNEAQLDWLCQMIEDHPVSPKGGRPCADKRRVLRGIFWILDNGAKWKSLPARFGSKSTVHRWFRRWAQEAVFDQLMDKAGRLVERRGGFKLYECFIDGTFSKAKGGGDGIGCTKAGKGVKIMIMVDAQGLPTAACSTSASPHESGLVQQLFEFMISRDGPERLIGDKAYDSDKLDAQMQAMGVELIAPHRSNRLPRNKTQDGRSLRRYAKRWTVERTIGWLQHFRRLCIRWEKSTSTFQAFLHLGCTLLLTNRVLG